VVVESGATPLVLKMDVLGLDGDKKYASDPNLSPTLYSDCEWSRIILFYKIDQKAMHFDLL